MDVRFPEEPRFPAWKIPFLQWLVVLTVLGLLAGYWRLQITRHEHYLEESQRNRIRDLPVIAPRGRILDRDGKVLVDNEPAFSILLSRDVKLGQDKIDGIAQGLGIDPSALEAQLQQTSLPRYQPLLIKKSATIDDVAFVESHRNEFPELDVIQVQRRFYPKHTVAAALLGYVGDVSAEAVAASHDRYQPGDVVGKTGIEREYNSVLTGRDGMRQAVVNSRGQEVGWLGTIPPQPGHDLRLTVDMSVQMAAEEALGDLNGAVVALDPRTGQVLALVSHPDVDPNEFSQHIDPQQWKQLLSNPENPIMDKAIQAQVAPGSVFKIVMSVAGLQSGTIKPNFSVRCPGYVNFYGHTYHDWTFWRDRRGHGTVDLHRAIVVSCDVYFYTLGKMLGIDKIAYYAKALGLGSKTGIDLPGEEPGLIPTPEWVEKRFHHKWYAGSTISVAIGQGAVAVTPLQLAEMIGGVASGGVFCRPHLVFRSELDKLGLDPPPAAPRRVPLSPATVQAVTSGMWGVVNQGGGTGGRARVAGLDIAGKTGTAQVVSVALGRSSHNKNYRDDSWFVGYSPSPNPEIVVAALVMHGGESWSFAVPIVGQVIKAYYQEHHPQDLESRPASPELAVQPKPSAPPRAAAAGVLP